jgi:hypothetical protein
VGARFWAAIGELTSLTPPQFPFSRDLVAPDTESNRPGIIAAVAIIIHIDFQNVLWPIRIMLQRGQTFHEPGATLVNEQP